MQVSNVPERFFITHSSAFLFKTSVILSTPYILGMYPMLPVLSMLPMLPVLSMLLPMLPVLLDILCYVLSFLSPNIIVMCSRCFVLNMHLYTDKLSTHLLKLYELRVVDLFELLLS